MSNHFSITPPPELIEQWMQAHSTKYDLARHAAQWGADQELESCIELLKADGYKTLTRDLRAARRPKPPTLKEQALKQLTQVIAELERAGMRQQAIQLEGPIRRALEALDD